MKFDTLSYVTTGCIWVSAFASLVVSPTDIGSSVVGLNTCAIIAGIQTYKLIINKKEKEHDKLLLLA